MSMESGQKNWSTLSQPTLSYKGARVTVHYRTGRIPSHTKKFDGSFVCSKIDFDWVICLSIKKSMKKQLLYSVYYLSVSNWVELAEVDILCMAVDTNCTTMVSLFRLQPLQIILYKLLLYLSLLNAVANCRGNIEFPYSLTI